MDLSQIASELLKIESRATDGVPPADQDTRWTELTVELLSQLRAQSDERRRWMRIPMPDAEVTLESHGRQITANTKTGNVSNTGMTVWVPRDALDTRPDRLRLKGIRFRGDLYAQDVECEAVWSHEWHDAHHVGLRFLHMTPQARRQFYPCYYRAYQEFLAHLAA